MLVPVTLMMMGAEKDRTRVPLNAAVTGSTAWSLLIDRRSDGIVPSFETVSPARPSSCSVPFNATTLHQRRGFGAEHSRRSATVRNYSRDRNNCRYSDRGGNRDRHHCADSASHCGQGPERQRRLNTAIRARLHHPLTGRSYEPHNRINPTIKAPRSLGTLRQTGANGSAPIVT